MFDCIQHLAILIEVTIISIRIKCHYHVSENNNNINPNQFEGIILNIVHLRAITKDKLVSYINFIYELQARVIFE
jgi:hypothetical protein